MTFRQSFLLLTTQLSFVSVDSARDFLGKVTLKQALPKNTTLSLSTEEEKKKKK